MARIARYVMGALGGAIVLFAAGPRTRVRLDGPPPHVPTTPSAVADMIAQREAAVLGVVPGTEARVVWGAKPGEKTPLAFVHLHGFSASRRETAPLSENVAKRYGANLFEARFTGHGRPGEALARATAEDWIRDTREAIAVGQVLGERVVIIASSTGATSALLVAAHDAPGIAAYVLLSPNFGPKSAASGLLLWPWAETWLPWIFGEEYKWVPDNEDHGKYWTNRYPVAALFPMMATVARVGSAKLERIEAPLLVLHSKDDHVVDAVAVEETFIRFKRAIPRARQVVDGPGDQHVLAGDVLSPGRTADIEARIEAFLRTAGIEP